MKSLGAYLFMFFACFALSAQVCPGGGGGTTTSSTGSLSTSTNTGSFTSGAVAGLRTSIPNNNFLTNAVRSGHYATAKQGYNKIDGSPYLNDEPIKGSLFLNNGTEIAEVPLQIDVYANEVIATNKKGEEIILDPKFYNEVRMPFEGQELVFKKINPNNPDQFYQVLYQDGDMVFFKEKDVHLKEGNNKGIVKFEPRFYKRTNYYIKQGEDQIANVKLKKKDIFSVFPETEIYAMKEYAQQKGIKLKKESDYIAMFEGANQ